MVKIMAVQRKATTRKPEPRKTRPLTILEKKDINWKIKNSVGGILINLEKYSSSPVKYLNNNKIFIEFAEAKALCMKIRKNKLSTEDKQQHIDALRNYLINYYKKSLEPVFKKFTTNEYNFIGSNSFKG